MVAQGTDWFVADVYRSTRVLINKNGTFLSPATFSSGCGHYDRLTMDPVNTLKSAVEVTIKVKQYLESVKNASEEQKKIQDEIGTALQFLLKLQDKANDKDWGETLTSLAVPSGPLQRFKSELEKIAKKLPLGAGTFSKAEKTLTWHFKKDDIDKILLSIERQKGYFQLALQTDHMYVILGFF